MDAPSEPLLKLNNVNDNLPMEKCFLNLRLFLFEQCFKRGAATNIFKRGGQILKGDLIIILKKGVPVEKGGLS